MGMWAKSQESTEMSRAVGQSLRQLAARLGKYSDLDLSYVAAADVRHAMDTPPEQPRVLSRGFRIDHELELELDRTPVPLNIQNTSTSYAYQ